MIALPIDPLIPVIREKLARNRALVVVAPPGSGKTTRVPPALAGDGRLILLQPRRVAARSLARRIAQEQRWTLGEEVGWQIRFERRFSARTRLLVATEGVLTARLQSDPLLSEFTTVVIDEFHERSIHADLAIALVREAWNSRDDLRVVVMSATLDAANVVSFFDGCDLVRGDVKPHPLEIAYAPDTTVPVAVREVLGRTRGHVLCFLPGLREIDAAARELAAIEARVHRLHGSLPSEEQDAALGPSAERKVILATNIAETSITVDGVDTVIDTGLHRIMRYDAARGIDSLELERIPLDAATQRAGRAARTGPGRAVRLWDERTILRPAREPEIARVDLCGPVLDVIAWGGDPRTFPWFERPDEERLASAIDLVQRLGIVDATLRLTPLGAAASKLPLHPRLGVLLASAADRSRAAAACVVISEMRPRNATTATDSDVESLVDTFAASASPAQRALEADLARSAERLPPGMQSLRHAVFAAFADRLARRRSPGSDELLLSTGHGARLAAESGVRHSEFLVAVDAAASEQQGRQVALVRMASGVDSEWIEPTGNETVREIDVERFAVWEIVRAKYDALVLNERRRVLAPADGAGLLAATAVRWITDVASGVLGAAPGAAADSVARAAALTRRARVAGVTIELEAILEQAIASGSRGAFDVWQQLDHRTRRDIDTAAPERIEVPSGRALQLDYRSDGTVVLSVKLQEMFGLADSPLVGNPRRPVVIELLSPAGRPVQTTSDLRSFWARTYPEVRKELRGRYPKHPWPEDPWNAPATHRTKKKM